MNATALSHPLTASGGARVHDRRAYIVHTRIRMCNSYTRISSRAEDERKSAGRTPPTSQYFLKRIMFYGKFSLFLSNKIFQFLLFIVAQREAPLLHTHRAMRHSAPASIRLESLTPALFTAIRFQLGHFVVFIFSHPLRSPLSLSLTCVPPSHAVVPRTPFK